MTAATQDTPKKPGKDKIIESLQKENADLRGTVASLNEQVRVLTQGAYAGKKPAPGIPADTFEVDGKNYRFKLAKANVRRLGERTALEMLVDNEPQEVLGGLTIKAWLVANNSSMVEEV